MEVVQSILARVLFYAVVCCRGCGISSVDRNSINKLIGKAGSIIGLTPDSLKVIIQQRTGRKLKSVKENENHPVFLASSFSERLVMPRCSSERFKKSFVPAAVKFCYGHCR